MRKKWRTQVVVAAAVSLVLSVVLLVGCGGELGITTTTASVGVTLTTAAVGQDGDHPAADIAAGLLSDEEREALIYLREEEKLAHDVYAVLHEKWGTRVFENIGASEARHMASMKTLLASYGLADPVGDNEIGVFANEDLQKLFDALVAQGSVSEAEALKVGVAIENKDIGDLERLVATTTHSDISQVAQNLLAGSRNHLSAFSKGR